MKGFMACCAVLLLSGCAHHPGECAMGTPRDDCLPGTNGYEQRQEQINNAVRAQRQRDWSDDKQCQSYGAKPGSDAYVNCRVQLSRGTR
jgi:hypothetical protein